MLKTCGVDYLQGKFSFPSTVLDQNGEGSTLKAVIRRIENNEGILTVYLKYPGRHTVPLRGAHHSTYLNELVIEGE